MDSQTQLVMALAPYIVPIIIALCVAFGKSLVSKLPTATREEALTIIGHVVSSVEQTGANMSGPAKKQAAVALIDGLLKNLHLSIPQALIDVYIESAVASMFPHDPSSPPSPSVVGFTPHTVA